MIIVIMIMIMIMMIMIMIIVIIVIMIMIMIIIIIISKAPRLRGTQSFAALRLRSTQTSRHSGSWLSGSEAGQNSFDEF